MMRTNITKTSMELFQSPQKYFLRHEYPSTFLFYRFNQTVPLHVILNRSDVESVFFWALEQLHGSISDIGAHQNFQMPEFYLAELLLKELCQNHGHVYLVTQYISHLPPEKQLVPPCIPR